jgi:uncharacterized protein
MPLRSRKRGQYIDVPVQDMVLRITGPDELYEEVRATGMQFWEQLQSYAIRNPAFQNSTQPLSVPEDAPAVIRQMAAVSNRAGVGPKYVFTGALVEYVGYVVARTLNEFVVTCGRDQYVVARKRARLTVRRPVAPGDEGLAVVVKPELGPHGIYSTLGRGSEPDGQERGLAVVANSCMLADAAAARARAILAKGDPNALRTALSYLQRLPGVHGAILMLGGQIGVAGALELAA